MSRNLTPQSTRPTEKELDLELKHLVRWQRFARHLPTIEQSDIEGIELDFAGSTENQKLALFGVWLRRCVSASWVDVISALHRIDENMLAEIIRSKYLYSRDDTIPLQSNVPICIYIHIYTV